jgi:signal peptidase I
VGRAFGARPAVASVMESSTAVLSDRVPLVAPAEESEERSRPGLLRRIGVGRLALAVLLVAVAGGLGYLRAWPPVATVMSGSMSPTIETGDVVVMKRIDGAPQVGDVVAVDVPEDARSRYGYPPQVIHRVVRIGPGARLTTKGDARRQNDPFTVPSRSVHAKVVATLPAAGRALAFLTSTLGLVWLGLGALLLIVMPLFDRQRELQEREQDGIEELGSDVQVVLEEVVRLRAAVDAEARARAAVERTLRELSAAAEAIRDEVSRPVAVPEPELAPPETEPEAELAPLEPEPLPPEPEPEPLLPEPEPAPFPPESAPLLPEPEPAPLPATAPDLPPAAARRRSGGLVGHARRATRTWRR